MAQGGSLTAPDTVLALGTFQFQNLEIPSRVRFGGKQQVTSHNLVGGARVLNVMGPFDGPISWEGLFFGANALPRAQALDALRRGGQELALTWASQSYQVVITDFDADYERQYQIPYRITCEVKANNALPVPVSAPAPIDTAVSADFSTAQGLSTGIGDSTLTGLVGSLGDAIGAVSSFATAAKSIVAGVQSPLASVQARVSALQVAASAVIGSVSIVGGLVAGTQPAQLAASVQQQGAAMNQSWQLSNLSAVLGRMETNLGNASAGPQSLPTAGGNLFSIAASEYGDATSWTLIANANGLTDPVLTSPQVLQIPPVPADSGGVLSA